MNTNKGFSLVELIVVIAIMAIIAAVAIPVYSSYVTKAEEAVELDSISSLIDAVKLANVEYSTKTTAEFDNENKTVTVTFYGEKSGDAAIQVSKVVSSNCNGSEIAINLSKSLGDNAKSDAEERLDAIRTYTAGSAGGSGGNAPQFKEPTIANLEEAINQELGKYNPDDYWCDITVSAGTEVTVNVSVFDVEEGGLSPEMQNDIASAIFSKFSATPLAQGASGFTLTLTAALGASKEYSNY